MQTRSSQVLVARRYLQRGFLDTAMELMVRHAPAVEVEDWQRLVDALMERQRVSDVVRVCEIGGVPIPRDRVLALGDARLRRRNVDGTKLCYEIGDADIARWDRFVDVLTSNPDHERLAIAIAERYLVGAGAASVANAV